MQIFTSEQLHGTNIKQGELLIVCVVRAANVVKDIRENIRNLVGGRMGHYEKLLQQGMEEGIEEMKKKAQEKGYDGIVGFKVAHPTVVEGAVELILYGNGFQYLGD